MLKIFSVLMVSTCLSTACDIADQLAARYSKTKNLTATYTHTIAQTPKYQSPQAVGPVIAGHMSVLLHNVGQLDAESADLYNNLIEAPTYDAWNNNVFQKYATTRTYTATHRGNRAITLVNMVGGAMRAADDYTKTHAYKPNGLSTDLRTCATKVVSGEASTVSAIQATQQQYIDLCTFLNNSALQVIGSSNKVQDLLDPYSFTDFKADSREYQHRKALSIVAAALWLGQKSDEKTITNLGAIQNLLGQAVSIEDIRHQLDYQYTKEAFQKLNIKVQESGDELLTPESEQLYKEYVNNPWNFYPVIKKDLEDTIPGPMPRGSKKRLIQNVIGFSVATQDPAVQNAIHAVWQDSSYILNTYTLSEALENLKNRYDFTSQVWVAELIQPRDVAKFKNPRQEIVANVKQQWKNVYEVLVHSYVYAKQEGILPYFFNNAFPLSEHCTGSLSSDLSWWKMNQIQLKAQKLSPDSYEGLEAQTRAQVKEIFESPNFFIDSSLKKIVHNWSIQYLMQHNDQAKNMPDFGKLALGQPSAMLYEFIPTLEAQKNAFVQKVWGLFQEEARTFITNTPIKNFHKIFPKSQRGLTALGIPISLENPLRNEYWWGYSSTDEATVLLFRTNFKSYVPQGNDDRKIQPNELEQLVFFTRAGPDGEMYQQNDDREFEYPLKNYIAEMFDKTLSDIDNGFSGV